MALGLAPGLNLFPVQCFRDMRPKLWGLVGLRPVCVSRRPWEPFRAFPGDTGHPTQGGTGEGALRSARSPGRAGEEVTNPKDAEGSSQRPTSFPEHQERAVGDFGCSGGSFQACGMVSWSALSREYMECVKPIFFWGRRMGGRCRLEAAAWP